MVPVDNPRSACLKMNLDAKKVGRHKIEIEEILKVTQPELQKKTKL